MSVVVMLMILGWSTFFAMIAYYSLKESGKLLKIRRRMALWLDNSLVPVGDSDRKNGLAREFADIQ